MSERILVTGGAGFIGANFVLDWLAGSTEEVVNLDKLTYAGRRENLHDVMADPRHTFVHGDIADAAVAGPLVEQSNIVVHFAAETHVTRSIYDNYHFFETDVLGTQVIANAVLRCADRIERFVGNGALLKDGSIMPADLVVLATGFLPQEMVVRKLLGEAIGSKVGPVWGFGADGEMSNMWKRTAQRGLWFAGGGFNNCRTYSRYLAMQIKAIEEGLLAP